VWHGNNQGKRPFLERNRLIRSTTFWVVSNAPLGTLMFPVSLNGDPREPGLMNFNQQHEQQQRRQNGN
ncbi:MAG TPA: hypothetical protein VFQ83_08685, partial [Candidatus Udaeobacter sp.]|nr:hypothetical protein [Candidatus Udaeobacter sp.]